MIIITRREYRVSTRFAFHSSSHADIDLQNLDKMTFNFELGTPFKPFEQLMGVLPVASMAHIPEAYRVRPFPHPFRSFVHVHHYTIPSLARTLRSHAYYAAPCCSHICSGGCLYVYVRAYVYVADDERRPAVGLGRRGACIGSPCTIHVTGSARLPSSVSGSVLVSV